MAGSKRLSPGAASSSARARRASPSHGRRTAPAIVATLAMAALLAACSTGGPTSQPGRAAPLPTGSATTGPSGAPTATPGASPTASTAPTPGPTAATASAAPTPGATAPITSATPAGDAWSPVTPAPEPPVGAELTAVAGSAYAMDPRAGLRLRATGPVPLATLLERLRVEPALAYRVQAAADGRSAVLSPASPLAPDAAYRVTLLGPAGETVTGWAFQVAGPPRVVATLPDDQATDVPTDTGIEITFDQDRVPVRGGDIVVRPVPDGPPVPGRVEMHGRAAAFVPAEPLLAGRVYQVTVRAGTGATAETTGLARAVVLAFRTQPVTEPGTVRATIHASLVTALPGERATLPAWAMRSVSSDPGEVEEVSTPLPVRVFRFASEAAALRALARLQAVPEWAGPEARPRVATDGLALAFAGRAPFVTVGSERNVRLPRATGRGWYLVELGSDPPAQAVLQVTDIVGLVAARGDRVVAWANDARARGPVVGASVAVVGGAALGRTDGRGVLTAPTPASLVAAAGSVLVRMRAGDGRRVVVELVGPEGIAARDEWTAASGPDRDAWWTAFSLDRWLYRATDTLAAWGYLRARDGHLPKSILLRVWLDAEGPRVGRPVAQAAATRASTGAFLASIPLRGLPHGQYLVQLVADGRLVETASFEVGVLRKPAYGLELAVAHRAVIAGTLFQATVTARFYDGTPAAAVPVTVGLDLEDAPGVSGATGTDGVARTAVPTIPGDEENDTGQYACPSLTARPDGPVEGDVEARREVCVFGGEELVDVSAVRNGGSVVVSGSVHRVDLGAAERWLAMPTGELDPRGAPVAGRGVAVVITEHVYRRVATGTTYDPITKRATPSWDEEEVSTSTITRTTTTRADGTYRLRLDGPRADRSWDVEAQVVDTGGRKVHEHAWVRTARAEREEVLFGVRVRGSDRVSVGQAVTAQVVRWRTTGAAAVATGAADRFLFLVTSPTRVEALVSRASTARTTFRAADEPNLEIVAAWFTGRTYVLPGAASASLRLADRRITVALQADRERYEPGATATVTVRTADRAGRPIAASVLLRGIDEKLVAMGVAAFADPLDLLYADRPVGFVAGPVSSHAPVYGVDGGKGSTVGRVDFADALPLRLVQTDASGTARVRFDLPDDITSWRVGAAALTADRRAGMASVLVPVGLPFFADATLAPEYLVGDAVAIRLRAQGSAITADVPVRWTVSSSTLGMPATVVEGSTLREATVGLPALTVGSHQVAIEASSSLGRDRLVRTFEVVASRLLASRREALAITSSVTPPGGPGATRLVLVDAGRARYLERLLGLAAPGGQRADERLAAGIARDLLVDELGVPTADLPASPAFDRSVYQGSSGGLALLPYASPDLELTVRALVARRDALVVDAARPWLRAIADDPAASPERHVVALVGLAALGEPVLDGLVVALDDPAAGDRTRLWAALGLAVLGDRQRAAAVEQGVVARFGERRGSLLRLRVSDEAEAVSEATELLALVAAWVDDPLALDALAYVESVTPRDDLRVLTDATVLGRLMPGLPSAAAVVALVQDGGRSLVTIPAGGTATLEMLPDQRAGLLLEPISGDAVVVASWEEPVAGAADLGGPDRDLGLTRTFAPAAPVPANSVVVVRLALTVGGPGRDGSVEVVEPVPSGLVPIDVGDATDDTCGQYGITPSRIDGQRVVFVASFSAASAEEDPRPTVPGTFCLSYRARVVTSGTYSWEPAVARQGASPTLVATTPPASIDVR